MKITKYGHACILVEKDDVRILVDPGNWNTTPDAVGIDAVLITHEHPDHFGIEQLKTVIANNPDVQVITHEAVGAKLDEAGILYTPIESGAFLDVKGISIESCGTKHAVVYEVSPCRNTGYVIGGELFVPGDALHDVPPKKVRVLGLPTGGPWMKLSEAIDYAKQVKPEIVFAIHDAMYTDVYRESLIPRVIGGMLEPMGIKFIELQTGETKDF